MFLGDQNPRLLITLNPLFWSINFLYFWLYQMPVQTRARHTKKKELTELIFRGLRDATKRDAVLKILIDFGFNTSAIK